VAAFGAEVDQMVGSSRMQSLGAEESHCLGLAHDLSFVSRRGLPFGTNAVRCHCDCKLIERERRLWALNFMQQLTPSICCA
jgi:hypothetical protein